MGLSDDGYKLTCFVRQILQVPYSLTGITQKPCLELKQVLKNALLDDGFDRKKIIVQTKAVLSNFHGH